MSGLWWLQPGWTSTRCASCGAMIWPGGDPDWGYCFECFSRRIEDQNHQAYPDPEPFPCEICGIGEAVTTTNGYNVCSQECEDAALQREAR